MYWDLEFPTSDSEEGMDSIGKRLSRQREKKGISIEEASSQTRIHHSILSALEEDRFDQIPSPTYVRGFLKRYAEYLGLDSRLIVEKYLATHPKEPKQVLVLEGEKMGKGFARRFVERAMVACVIIGLCLVSYHIIRSIISKPKATQEEVAKVEEAAVSPAVPAKPPPRPRQEVMGEPLNLTVRATQEVWLQVTVDGEVMFQDTLSPKQEESWTARDRISLWVGNAGGLELVLNGRPLGSPGRSGEVIKDIILTKEGMEIIQKRK